MSRKKKPVDNIHKFRLFGQDRKGFYMLDVGFDARIYAPPTLII